MLPVRALVWVIALGLLVAAVLERISVPGSVAVLVFAAVTLALANRLLAVLGDGDTVGFESAWGGLGGGLGGWQVSRALAYLMALSLAGLLLTAAAAAEIAGLASGSEPTAPQPPVDAGSGASDDGEPDAGSDEPSPAATVQNEPVSGGP